MLGPQRQLTKEQKKVVKEIFVQFGVEHDLPGWNDPKILEEDEPEVVNEEQALIDEIPELKQPAPKMPSVLTEEMIKRNVERKYKRLVRQVDEMFRPPGQELYMTNRAFKESIDKCDAEYQRLAREDGKVPYSLVDVMFPYRNTPDEVVKEFKDVLRQEIEAEARDPAKYSKEHPLPPQNELGQFIIPTREGTTTV